MKSVTKWPGARIESSALAAPVAFVALLVVSAPCVLPQSAAADDDRLQGRHAEETDPRPQSSRLSAETAIRQIEAWGFEISVAVPCWGYLSRFP